MFHLRLAFTALRGLYQNLLRSLLATLGVIIGVGAVVAAVSILQGAQRDVLDRFESLGADQVMVFNGSERRQHRVTQIQSLEPDDARLIERENPEFIIATAPQYQGLGQIKYLASNTVGTILGTTEAYAEINSYNPVAGRFITKQDVAGSTMVCVLGHQVAEDLFGARPAVGRAVKINGKSLVVVGVMEERLRAEGLGIKMVCARGPMTTAGWIVGLSNLLMELITHPEPVTRFLETITATLIRWLWVCTSIYSGSYLWFSCC